MDDLTRALQAWHGSPHDFEEFRDDKIGTGEGTKAMGGYGVYGHGHYVAEERKVGEGYRDRLTQKKSPTVAPKLRFRGGATNDQLYGMAMKLQELRTRVKRYEEQIVGHKMTRDKIAAWAKEDNSPARKNELDRHNEIVDNFEKSLKFAKQDYNQLEEELDHYFPEFIKERPEIQDWMTDMIGELKPDDPLGSFSEYINRARQLFDDKKENLANLNEAAVKFLPHVKDFELEKQQEPQGRLYELNLHVGEHELLDWDEMLEGHHDEAVRKILSIPEVEAATEAEWNNDGDMVAGPKLHPEYAEGEQVYKHLVEETGSAVKASNRLLEHGIRGIRYKDGNSRNGLQELHLDGKPIDVFSHQDNPLISAVVGVLSKGPVKSLNHLAQSLNSASQNAIERDRSQLFASARDWVTNNRDRLELKEKPPTYNYVIFDPQAIKIMRKLGMKGEVIKDFTDTGVHVKPKK